MHYAKSNYREMLTEKRETSESEKKSFEISASRHFDLATMAFGGVSCKKEKEKRWVLT
jgi:hypothetical protein